MTTKLRPVPTKNFIWRSLTVWSGFGMHKSSEVIGNSSALGKGWQPSCGRRSIGNFRRATWLSTLVHKYANVFRSMRRPEIC